MLILLVQEPRFNTIQTLSKPQKVLRNVLYSIEDTKRATDFHYRRDMSVNVSPIRTPITKNTLHGLRKVIYKLYATTGYIIFFSEN